MRPGLYAFGGVLAALHARDKTGKGQRVELNMLESAIAFIPDAFAYWTQTGAEYGPLSRVASSQCFAWVCADGHAISIHLSVPDKFWSSLLDALDAHATLGINSRFKSRKDRVANYLSLAEEIGKTLRTKRGRTGKTSLPSTTCRLRRSTPFLTCSTIRRCAISNVRDGAASRTGRDHWYPQSDPHQRHSWSRRRAAYPWRT